MNSFGLTGGIPSIKPVQAGEVSSLLDRSRSGRLDSPSFADVLKGMVNDVSELNVEAQDAIAAFVRGEDVELHQVMAAVEEANLSLEMLVEIKNKLVDAYRTITSMQ